MCMITWCHNHHHHHDRRRDCRRQSHYSVFNIFSCSRSTSHVIATCSLPRHDQSHPLDKSLLDGRSSDRLQPRRPPLHVTAAGPRTDRRAHAIFATSTDNIESDGGGPLVSAVRGGLPFYAVHRLAGVFWRSINGSCKFVFPARRELFDHAALLP